MKKVIFFFFCCSVLFLQCGPGISDYHNRISNDLFFSSDGSRTKLFIGERHDHGIRIDSILIHPTITQIKHSDEYVIIEQSPNRELIVSDFAQDYCAPISSEDQRMKCIDFADSVINRNVHFKKIFSQRTNYWIVRVYDHHSFGPYSYSQFLLVKDSLHIDMNLSKKD